MIFGYTGWAETIIMIVAILGGTFLGYSLKELYEMDKKWTLITCTILAILIGAGSVLLFMAEIFSFLLAVIGVVIALILLIPYLILLNDFCNRGRNEKNRIAENDGVPLVGPAPISTSSTEPTPVETEPKQIETEPPQTVTYDDEITLDFKTKNSFDMEQTYKCTTDTSSLQDIICETNNGLIRRIDSKTGNFMDMIDEFFYSSDLKGDTQSDMGPFLALNKKCVFIVSFDHDEAIYFNVEEIESVDKEIEKDDDFVFGNIYINLKDGSRVYLSCFAEENADEAMDALKEKNPNIILKKPIEENVAQ